MIEDCVEFRTQEEDVSIMRPKRINLKEVVLRRDERAERLQEELGLEGSSKAGGGSVQINKKALQQQEEEFEK